MADKRVEQKHNQKQSSILICTEWQGYTIESTLLLSLPTTKISLNSHKNVLVKNDGTKFWRILFRWFIIIQGIWWQGEPSENKYNNNLYKVQISDLSLWPESDSMTAWACKK